MNKAQFEMDEVVSQEGEVAHGGGTFSFSERIEFLKRFGRHSMAFSALQPKMRYFDMEGVGYIAYRKQWGSVVCLGDPVCAPEDRDQLLSAFLKKYKSPTFIQVTPPVAALIHEKTGFYATQFGKETLIDLDKWTLSGKKKTGYPYSS